jgi:peptidyl-prolyl cis-trans isomerase C
VKSATKCIAPAVLFLFLGLWFSSSAGAAQGSSPKAGSPASAPTAKAQAKSGGNEAVPVADPNAIFPAVIATIDGKPILGRDLEILVRRELAPIGNPEWKNLREDYRGQLTLSGITTLINSKLIYQKALASGVQASDADIQAELDKIAKTYKSDAEMNEALAQQMMDRDSLRASLSQSLAISKYIDTVIGKSVTVTPEELAQYYSTHPSDFSHPDIIRVSHILIRGGETSEQDALAKKRAESILARVKKGEDFAILAKENSADSSASAGGDLGYVTKDALDPKFGEATYAMPVGEPRLVETLAGYHVVKVVDKKKEGVAPLEEVKPSLTQFLKNEKVQVELTKLINQLKEQSKIEVLIPYGQPLVP